MILSSVLAFSLAVCSRNFGKFNANSSTNESNNCCPAFIPLGSVTFKSEFLPLRSTIKPFDNSTLKLGGFIEPSRIAWLGLYLFPPNAHAIESRILVLP